MTTRKSRAKPAPRPRSAPAAAAPPAFDPEDAAPEGSGVFGLPHSPEEAAVVLLPVPWDLTTSYRPGTVDGPRAILAASRQVDLFDGETGNPWEGGIAMLPEDPRLRRWNRAGRPLAERVIRAGGVRAGGKGVRAAADRVNGLGEECNRLVHDAAREWLDRGKVVGLVGGDHSTPFGSIRAHAEVHGEFGILHFDAHADLRRSYEGFTWSHASIMHNVVTRIPQVTRLVQVGIRDYSEDEFAQIRDSGGRIRTHFAANLRAALWGGKPWRALAEEIVAGLPDRVYVSFDIDGLEPHLCPHTGTPVPGGLEFAEANFVLRVLAESGRRIIGFDLNEVAPGPKGDEWDGNVGARLLYKMIGWTLRSRAR
ncbi:MAG: agmatinase family protein [Planctomycetes bacterium]|nr:agmatinase family protein [Planctomycetota bacterium]